MPSDEILALSMGLDALTERVDDIEYKADDALGFGSSILHLQRDVLDLMRFTGMIWAQRTRESVDLRMRCLAMNCGSKELDVDGLCDWHAGLDSGAAAE